MFNNVNTHRCFIMSMMYIRNLVDLHLKYYTDAHDVDEDLRTISFHGGMFIDGRQAGVTQRYTRSDVPHSSDAVASSDIRKKSLIIRIIMMSTKA